jgi:type VI secretion system protein
MAVRGILDRLSSPAQRRTDELTSVTEHLRVLLNARQGASESASRFGVTDFNSVVHNMPDALGLLQVSIRQTILEHEPRLEQVFVQHVPGTEALSLRFEIRARLRRTRATIRLHTLVNAAGHYTVR